MKGRIGSNRGDDARRSRPGSTAGGGASALTRVATMVLMLLVAPVQARGQAPLAEKPAEVIAEEFLWGFQRAEWTGLAQRIHPEGLAYLRIALDILVEYDDTGGFLAGMFGGATREEFEALDDGEALVRAMRWVEGNVPGLVSALAGRRTEVLGEVAEGDHRHVVYRTTQIASGAQPEIRVLTLARADGAWKVASGQELVTLHTALRGIPRAR